MLEAEAVSAVNEAVEANKESLKKLSDKVNHFVPSFLKVILKFLP